MIVILFATNLNIGGPFTDELIMSTVQLFW